MKDLLIEHIKIDLQEEYGHLPMLHKYAEAFANALPKKYTSGQEFTIDNSAFQSIPERFFNNINIRVCVTRSDNPFTVDNSISYYSSNVDTKIDENGKLDNVEIFLKAIIHNSNDIVINLVRKFEHELTHAYENYNRLSQNKASLIDAGLQNGEDIRQKNNPSAPIEKMLCDFLYIMSSYEVNANIGSISSELKGHEEELKNNEKIDQVIKSTGAYQQYMAAYDFIKLLYYIKYNPDTFVQETGKDFKRLFSMIEFYSNFKFHTLNQVIRWAEKLWNKWERKFENRIGKVIGDIIWQYDNNKANGIVDRYNSKSTQDPQQYWEK